VSRNAFWKLGLGAVLAIGLQAQALANGALAIDSNQGDQYGFAYNHPSMGAAEQRALSECGSGCRIVLRFNSGCAAYAADQANGSTAYGWATAGSAGAAQGQAQSECRQRGGSSCTVRVWGCNSK
jgi:hypothetical protein